MLIHIGNDDFVDIKDCVAIFNVSTLSQITQASLKKNLGSLCPEPFRSAILTKKNRWLGSVISSDSLTSRGGAELFPGAVYLRKSASSGEFHKPEDDLGE